MFNDAILPEPNEIIEIENPPRLTEISEKDGIFFNTTFSSDKRIRSYVYDLLLKAKTLLPTGVHFMVYEAYRPLSAQIKLWEDAIAKVKVLHPEWDEHCEEFISECNIFAANPYKQGSGHQTGGALDITLVNDNGEELEMGCKIRDISPLTETETKGLPKGAKKNRRMLKRALTAVGFVNYPAEWWHYSFGERLWAKLKGSKLAIFAKLDI